MTPSKPVAAAKKAAGDVVDAVAEAVSFADKPVPGTPGSEPPSLEEPTEPRDAPPPKPDQQQPTPVSPTGAPSADPSTASAQQGAYLTTATGARIGDSDHSLKAGPRGPTLARRTSTSARRSCTSTTSGSRSESSTPAAPAPTASSSSNGAASGISRAGVLGKGEETRSSCASRPCSGPAGRPTRCATSAASRRSSTPSEGNWDLVGNNIPVFFIQDGIKFPDVIHAGKPHPDREIPQAQSAHDTFWDFVSLHTEAQHHTIWNMSDRGIPRSLPDDGGLRRPHLPAGRRRRRDDPGQVPLEAAARRALPDLGGGPARRRGRPGLPPPRPLRRHRVRRLPGVGPRHPDLPRHPGPDVRGDRPARLDQAGAGGAGAGAGRRHADAQREPDELLRRDRAGRLPHRPPRARASTAPTTRCCRPATSPTSTPSSPVWAGRTSTRSRSTARTRR